MRRCLAWERSGWERFMKGNSRRQDLDSGFGGLPFDRFTTLRPIPSDRRAVHRG
jgi:hypothetical protein